MTPDEKEIMTLTIETAMLKGFERFAETMDNKITKDIEAHKVSCRYAPPVDGQGLTLGWFVRNWRTVAVGLVLLSWLISDIAGRPRKFSIEQVKQIAQQVQETTAPDPIKNE